MILDHTSVEKPQQQGPDAWHLRVGHDICGDVQQALNHEWLVTNGLGGYAAGSICGATTRSYHGLLVAALQPPVARTVFVSKVDEEITLPGGEVLKLGVNEYHDKVVDPQGYQYLQEVVLDGDVPCFRYRLTDQLELVKRVWMEYGQNTTYIQYTLEGAGDEIADENLTLTLVPFCLSRDYHASTQGSDDWHFIVDSQHNRCRIRAYNEAPVYHLIAGPSAFFSPTGLWYWRVLHRRESERGLLDQEDVYQPGIFRMPITTGMRVTFVLSAEQNLPSDLGGPRHEELVTAALVRHQRRVRQLLSVAERTMDNLEERDPVLARLVVAADQFIVARPNYAQAKASRQPLRLAPDRKTIIAGYPWFTDWGRDSMISLPGLLLATGRYSEARGLLKAFASYTHEGLIPNRFPDQGEHPEYNTIDATLWMFHALGLYLQATDDWSLLKELFPVLQEIIVRHEQGTLFNIGMDATDGLLHGGTDGVQLTWMDAKVDGWVVTPRRGKPVEINALWYAALTKMEAWAVRLSTDASHYSQLRTLVRQHFARRFWYAEGGYLYDVVDVDGNAGQTDASLRPNQLFAVSLCRDLLSGGQCASILQQVEQHLLTPLGLRSLSPTDPAYHQHFSGNRWQRDSAYHQGTVWQWLLGPFIDVHLRVHKDRDQLRTLLLTALDQLWQNCLGTISEVAEPEPPYVVGGCVAQAWSVAEFLRCWLLLQEK
ncbi:glycogen debranching protein [Ktedonobacter sp. SOSP1-85]|uniref:amylo-alpha-1,6-glucosidase n=1 Tax=Ktedonobacter sp. SOSP1-85 TaxID=2778367 RepID=UPI00191612DA|nr:amylo-alpha-1,6-glucosidase [Ktedonobacter sp. SOSP1-85]GHO73523.1 glycogen debranching protein [Ktedonobacter sp. SOSP1-85]